MRHLKKYEEWMKPFNPEVDNPEQRIEELIKLIKKHNPDFKWSDKPIYRGDYNNISKIYISDGNIKPRKSANTKNYYTYLWDSDKNYYTKDYPKRNMSVICSTEAFIAEDFGVVYRVIPFKNAKIGVCSSDDFWDSFPKLKKLFNEKFFSMDDFNHIIENIYTLFTGEKMSDENEEIFFKQLNEIFLHLNNTSNEEIKRLCDIIHTDWRRHYKIPYEDVYKFPKSLEELFALIDPNTNDFQSITYNEYCTDDIEKREIFIEGGHILIEYDMALDIEKKII